ncbi:hypothetical protein NQ318_001180, partial [Aromia moschata]
MSTKLGSPERKREGRRNLYLSSLALRGLKILGEYALSILNKCYTFYGDRLLTFRKYDGTASTWRRICVSNHATPSTTKSTANEHDEGPYTLHLQAIRDVEVFVF